MLALFNYKFGVFVCVCVWADLVYGRKKGFSKYIVLFLVRWRKITYLKTNLI